MQRRSDPIGRGAASLRTAWAGVLAAWVLSGCAGYRLGPTNGIPAGARAVEVRPFANETFEPRLTEAVTQQLRKQLQQDGSYRLATHDPGDIVVTGSLVKYVREPLSFQPKDVITTRDYSIHLTARVRAVDVGNGRVLFDRDLVGRTTVRNVPDLGSAERQAATLVAENLAQSIRSLLVDGSW